jgi:hypothetical protein
MSMTQQQQHQFQTNMKNLEELINKYKEDINKLKKSKKKYKDELKKIYEINEELGLDDEDNFDKIRVIYKKYKDIYKVNNFIELIKKLFNINNDIINVLEYNNYNNIYDLIENLNNTDYTEDIIVNYNLSLNKNNNIDDVYYTNYIKYSSIRNNNIINTNYNKIISKNTEDKIIRPSKVTLNKAFYNKYLSNILKNNNKIIENKLIVDKYKDYIEDMYLDNEAYDNKWLIYSYNSLNNNLKNTPRKKKQKTDQYEVVDEIINKLKNNLDSIKNKEDDKLYKIVYDKNRKDINLYSYIYSNNKVIEKLKNIDINIDKNTSRLKLMLVLFINIKKNKKIYNSDYIFNYYTFKKLNKSGLNILIPKLEELCKNTPVEDESESEEDNFIYENFQEVCNECLGILKKDELIIGYCKKCQEKIKEMEDNYKYEDEYEYY